MRRWRWWLARALTAKIRAAVKDCRPWVEPTVGVPPVERGLKRLVHLLRDEAAIAAAEERLRHRRALRLAGGLRPYFGAYTLVCFERSAPEGARFESEMERLARVFLGRRAAAAVLERSKPDLGMAWGGD